MQVRVGKLLPLLGIVFAVFSSFVLCSCEKAESKPKDQQQKESDIEGSKNMSPNLEQEEADILSKYLMLWKDEKYEEMYECLSEKAKKEMDQKQFIELLKREKEVNGGIESVTDMKRIGTDNVLSSWSMTLNFRRSTAGAVKIKAGLARDGNRFLIEGGGLIPLNPDDYDR